MFSGFLALHFFQIPLEVKQISNSLFTSRALPKKKKKELYNDSVCCKYINTELRRVQKLYQNRYSCLGLKGFFLSLIGNNHSSRERVLVW